MDIIRINMSTAFVLIHRAREDIASIFCNRMRVHRPNQVLRRPVLIRIPSLDKLNEIV